MPDDVKISEMSEAASLDNSAQFPYVQLMNGNLTTLKAPLSQIGTKINEGMTFSNLQTSSKNIVGAINEVAQGGGVEYATELPISSTDPTDTKSYIDNKTTLVKSASGSLIHITDGGDNIPLKSCEITIDPDLTGHTEANLVVCGKNLLKTGWTSGTYNGITFTVNSDGTITLSGTATANTWRGFNFYLPKGSYVYSSGVTESGFTTYITKDGTTIARGNSVAPFTLTEFSDLILNIYVYNGVSVNTTLKLMIRVASDTDETYEQYNGTTYNIPFGTTVTTGGTLDVINGVLTVGGVETQLTPVTPKTLSGINNIYNDCGDTAIEYFTESADEESELFDVKTGGGYKIQPIVYSTEEREVGVWLDGKPLYQKSFQFSEALSVSYSSWTNTAISKTDYDTIIRAQCSTLAGSFIGEVLVNNPSGSDYLQLQTTRNGSNISAKYLTIYYTKLSDAAGSGQWTPQGVPAVHYSENEQVIGTWIDGSTLYEKTIDFGALPNNTTKSVNHGIINLDKVAFFNGIAYKSGDIIPIPFSHSGNVSNQPQLSIGNTTVNIRTANDQSDRTGYITVRYTKSST